MPELRTERWAWYPRRRAGLSGPSHLRRRDRWIKPAGATDDDVQIMVQYMESSFLADKDCLVHPTRRCRKPYDKGRHSLVLLAELNPQKVAAASPRARQLLARLRSIHS